MKTYTDEAMHAVASHDCKIKEKGFCECTEDLNLGLSAQEEAEALDAIEHEKATLVGKGVTRIIDNLSD